jgi:eukaryotic-like serine/threonine-protein kinase
MACTLLSLLAISLAACSQASPGSPTPQPGQATGTPTPRYDIPMPVTLPPITPGTHPNVVFFTNSNPNRTSFTGLLERYDIVTRQSATILTMPGAKIEEAQLSSDGQWILFIAYVTDHDELGIVRIDGQHLQTLLAAPPYAGLNSAQWSPNQQYIVFDQQPPESGPTITYLLDVQHTRLRPLLTSGNGPNALAYAPRKWLSATQLALVSVQNSSSLVQNIYLLDTSKAGGQLQQVSGGSSSCKDFDANSDGTQLFISSCSIKDTQQGETGSSTITVQPVNGGTPRTIFQSSTLAVQTIRFLQPHTLLLLTSSELWTINTDGSGLRHVSGSSSPRYLPNFLSFAPYSQSSWANVSRDGSLFALQAVQSGVDTHTSSLAYSAFSDGVLHTFASAFVGLVSPGSDFYLAGWTTF